MILPTASTARPLVAMTESPKTSSIPMRPSWVPKEREPRTLDNLGRLLRAFFRFGRKPPNLNETLLVYIRISGRGMRTAKLQALDDLTCELSLALHKAWIGHYELTDFSTGEAAIAFSVQDADRAFKVIKPLLEAAPIAGGGAAVKIYGKAPDPHPRREKVSW